MIKLDVSLKKVKRKVVYINRFEVLVSSLKTEYVLNYFYNYFTDLENCNAARQEGGLIFLGWV